MTKYAAIQQFFESFGLRAYPSVSVPTSGDEMPEFPYLTYSVSTDSDLGRIMGDASLWYRGESWLPVNAKVDEISRMVGDQKVVECDDGAIVIRKSRPWAQPMGDESDNMIKRKILNFEFLYVTVY